MPPPGTDKVWRQRAPFHLQVKVISVTIPSRTPGDCVVQAKALRVFRASVFAIRSGSILSFSLACKREKEPGYIGGYPPYSVRELLEAKFMEVFLNQARDGELSTGTATSSVIEGPTEQPVIPP